MSLFTHLSLCGAVAALALSSVAAQAADALQVVRIGGLRADSMIRLYHAERAGYLAQEGIKPEFTMLGSGPAVAQRLHGHVWNWPLAPASSFTSSGA